ncbi:hypothetical protein AEQU1_01742 [Aequorivita sp. CIP111184]|nr:hypothetical protein AEQU1_01742 [Aequorivita sp. CIP111184]
MSYLIRFMKKAFNITLIFSTLMIFCSETSKKNNI